MMKPFLVLDMVSSHCVRYPDTRLNGMAQCQQLIKGLVAKFSPLMVNKYKVRMQNCAGEMS